MVLDYYNCIPNSCARIVFQRYIPEFIRYRYGDNDWNQTEGDRYELKATPGICRVAQTREVATIEVYIEGGRSIHKLRHYWGSTYQGLSYGGNTLNVSFSSGVVTRNFYLEFPRREGIIESAIATQINNEGQVNTYQCNESLCNLKIFKQNEKIIDLTINNECPEVEAVGCKLSDIHEQIIINKAAYLERIEIRDHYLLNTNLGLLPAIVRQDIPENCLCIYKSHITAPVGISEYFPTPNIEPFAPFDFIAQICSADGCPPPEYTVYCDCDCESCPEDSCAVPCGDRICCYTSDGIAHVTIPIENYCNVL